MLYRNHKAEGAYLVVIWSHVTHCSGWSLITRTSRNAKSWSPLDHMCLLSRGPYRETLISPICLWWYDDQEAESVGMSERCSAPLKQRSLQIKNTDDTDTTSALEVIRYIFRHLGAPYPIPSQLLPTHSLSFSKLLLKRHGGEHKWSIKTRIKGEQRPTTSCVGEKQTAMLELSTRSAEGECHVTNDGVMFTSITVYADDKLVLWKMRKEGA